MGEVVHATRRLALAIVATVWLAACPAAFAEDSAPPEKTDPARAAQATVDAAVPAFRRFVADPNMGWFRENVGRAHGLMIVPTHFKGGFLIGGAGGVGVLLGRDSNGLWSQPAFYDLGGPTIGFQIGGQWSEMVLLFMSEQGLRSMLRSGTQLKVGADLSVAVGPVGIGAQGATADILAYARSKGLFGGATIDGTFIAPNELRNEAYYGQPVTPREIVISRKVINDGAWELIEAVTHGAKPR